MLALFDRQMRRDARPDGPPTWPAGSWPPGSPPDPPRPVPLTTTTPYVRP
ncbi:MULTISPECIES: hypothetical protein [unclassified Nonomuraea]